MEHITEGVVDDVQPVELTLPDEPVAVDLPPAIGNPMKDYVWKGWKESAMRIIGRMRSLLIASALLDGRDVCNKTDLEHVLSFKDYWERMILS
jgi:hypothetical protein